MHDRWTVAVVFGVAALLGAASRLDAQSATQVVRFRVLPASRAAVEPVRTPLSMHGATTAQAETRYAFGTSEPNRKLLASLDRAMPDGVSLTVTLTPPSGATTAGPVMLDTVATDLLTSIPVASEAGLPVRYTLRAGESPSRASVEERDVTVTYTVVEQP